MATLRPFGLFGGPDPFRELHRLQNELERLVGGFVPTDSAAGFPAVNLYAGPDGVALVAELPGVAQDEVEVEVQGDTLTLRGTRRPAAEREDAYHRRERRSGAFSRTVPLPYRVDPERVEARLENGVLRLSLPRPEQDKPRRIAIGG